MVADGDLRLPRRWMLSQSAVGVRFFVDRPSWTHDGFPFLRNFSWAISSMKHEPLAVVAGSRPGLVPWDMVVAVDINGRRSSGSGDGSSLLREVLLRILSNQCIHLRALLKLFRSEDQSIT